MTIQIPEKVTYIIGELYKNGYEAFAVGGCVRDSILGRTPQDWDITTSAKPLEVKKIFKRTVDTGLKHGTVTVMLDKEGFEVTTYRIDGIYEDNRHPKDVSFTSNLEEDLKRRDFTINAMAYNEQSGLVDIFGGLKDIKNRLIRCVGDAGERFDEDALRILRAVRFSAQLGFEIEAQTCAAMSQKAEHLKNISAERIQTELIKLLVSDHPEYIDKAFRLGLTRIFLPEYDAIAGMETHSPKHIYTVDVHTQKAMRAVAAVPTLRLTMLMHDFGKYQTKKTDENGKTTFKNHAQASAEIARQILRRLKFDNDTTDRVTRLIRWHSMKYNPEPADARRALNRVGKDIFEDFLKVQTADLLAKSPAIIEDGLKLLKEKEALYRQIMDEGQCFEIKMLAVNGRDLIQAGFKTGPALGQILEQLTEAVIDDQTLNTKEQLIQLALDMKSK